MNKVIIFFVLVVFLLIVSTMLIVKSQPNLNRNFWYKVAAICTAASLVFSFLAAYSLLVYSLIIGLMIFAVSEASKHMFSTRFGCFILGAYLGLWLSIPVGIYQWTI